MSNLEPFLKKHPIIATDCYYAHLFYSAETRRHVAILFALREEWQTIQQSENIEVAKPKLEWWKQELTRFFQGSPQHPLTQGLISYQQHWLPYSDMFAEILQAYDWDNEYQGYQTEHDLQIFFQYKFGHWEKILHLMLHGEYANNPLMYENIAFVNGWLSALQYFPKYLDQNRLYFSEEELNELNINSHELFAHDPAAICCLLESKAKQLIRLIEQQQQLLSQINFPNSFIQSRLNQALLKELSSDPKAIADQIISLTPLRKLWIAWRANRHYCKLINS